jgi:hypothetical protein
MTNPNPNTTPSPDHQQPSTNSTSARASWSRSIAPDGSNAFAIPAPGVAGTVRRQEAPDRQDAAEGGPHPAGEQQHVCHTAQCTHAAPANPRAQSRPRQKGKKKRTRQPSCRMNEEEYALLQKAAATCNMSEAAFLAQAALRAARDLDRTAAEIADAKQLATELFAARRHLGRIGTNLNQITKAINSGAEPTQTGTVLAAVLRAAQRVDDAAAQLLNQQGTH